MTAGTAMQKVLKCQFCGTTTKKNGEPYESDTGMRYHEATCKQNPDRVNWAKYSTHKKRKQHANGKRESVQRIPPADGDEAQFKNHIAFAYGHCKTFLDLYAESIGIPGAALAHRVGEILFRTTRGRILGPFNPMPGL